jgi:hypothetical protein
MGRLAVMVALEGALLYLIAASAANAAEILLPPRAADLALQGDNNGGLSGRL